MTLHVGLIGGGNISETHARAASNIPGLVIAAVFGTNQEKVARLCAECGAIPYADFEKSLPRPWRFKADLMRVKKWIETGILGQLILADARVKWFRPASYYGESRWRGTLRWDGGGALINQAIHTVDLLLWLCGEVSAVQAVRKTALHKIETEDTLVALLEFKNGAIGTLQAATSVFPGYPRRVELTGSEKTVIIEHDRLLAADLREPPEDFSSTGDDRNASSTSPTVSDVRGHQAVLADFVHAIETNATPRCSGTEGRRSVALVEAIYTACQSGRLVELKTSK